MTSIIKVDEIQNKAGTTTLDANKLPDMLSGSVKVWVNFNSSGATIRDSFNVGTITDNGTGSFTINFSNNMTDGNYSASGLVALQNDAGGYNPLAVADRVAASCRADTENASSVQSDAVANDVQVHGDLA